MEPEKIGIKKLIEQVYKKPTQYAGVIARMTGRLVLQKLHKNHNEGSGLGLPELMAMADTHPTRQQIMNIRPVVKALIEEHATGKIPEGLKVDTETRNTIAKACMALLGDDLNARGFSELGHYVHDTPHVEQALFQPERLEMMEHGIIPENRIHRDMAPENDQLWIGHDTTKEFQGRDKSRLPNTIIRLKKGEHNNVSIVLKGDRIHQGGSQTLLFRDKQVVVHAEPEREEDGYKFPIIVTLAHDLGTITSPPESESVEGTRWCMHRITEFIEQESAESTHENTTTKRSVTLCVNSDHPRESYVTSSKRYRVNKTAFTIDSEKKELIVLGKSGKKIIPLPYSRIIGVYKHVNVEYLYFLDANSEKKKMRFEGGAPIFEEIEPKEEEFFQRRK